MRVYVLSRNKKLYSTRRLVEAAEQKGLISLILLITSLIKTGILFFCAFFNKRLIFSLYRSIFNMFLN